ncbi:MAG: ribbon-helix-helix domain-containing protein [Actinomycetia bacterium]|nr:ribbon-helix-helix domain-containing protein [Actinomycetes bacterium]
MKISISLPDDDVQFLDEYAKAQGITSRSAAVHTAIRMLKSSKLGDSYAAAWQEWADSGEDEIWASTTRDGLS